MSQDGLRGLAGMARTHLTMIENDTIYANIETVWKIADALDLRPSELSARVKETIPNDGMGAVTAPILFYIGIVWSISEEKIKERAWNVRCSFRRRRRSLRRKCACLAFGYDAAAQEWLLQRRQAMR